MVTTKITPGCILLEQDGQGILLGCVAEVVKYIANLKLGHVKLVGIVLTDTTHVAGISNWAIEFPIYKALFIDGGLAAGRKLAIVGTEAQLARARELIRITLLGPTNAEYRAWSRKYGVPHLRYNAIKKSCELFRLKNKEGTPYKLDELVEFRSFSEANEATIGGFTVRRDGKDAFSVSSANSATEKFQLEFRDRPVAPFALAASDEVHRPFRLAVRVLTYGNGFDPSSGCTALVVWLNGIPVLWDAAPFVSEALGAYGLNVENMGGIFLTHVHDDHSSLLEFKELGRKARIFTTPEVYESVLIKIAALLDYRLENPAERAELERFFEFRRIDADRATTVYGVDVVLHQCIHSIPTWGATFVVRSGDKKKRLLLTGDTVGPRKLRALAETGGLSPAWALKLSGLPNGDEDLAIMDGGADPAELHPNPMTDPDLRELMQKMGRRLYFGHRTSKPDSDSLLNLVSAGTLLVVDEGHAGFNDYGAFSQALAGLGVTDEFDVRALFSLGEIRAESPGETIIEEGSQPDFFYAVLYGTVAVTVGDEVVAQLNGGSFFGEMAILTNSRRVASVETVSAVRLLAIPKDAFATFADAHRLLPKLQERWKNRNLLAQVQLFRSLPASGMTEVSDLATRCSFDAGVVIVSEGSTTDDLYVVEEGEVEVLRNGSPIPLATLGALAVFGEMAALLSEPRSATVRSKGAVKLLKIRGSALRCLAATSVSLNYNLRTLISERRQP